MFSALVWLRLWHDVNFQHTLLCAVGSLASQVTECRLQQNFLAGGIVPFFADSASSAETISVQHFIHRNVYIHHVLELCLSVFLGPPFLSLHTSNK